MRGRVSEVVVPAGLVLLCMAFFFGVIVPPTLRDTGLESVVSSYDFHSYFLPRFMLGAQQVRAGHWPLWNPFEYQGVPLLAAAQPLALYPPKVILFALLPTQAAYLCFLVGHYLVSGWGFLLFAREQKLHWVAVFTGTALWVFSLSTLASNYHPNRIPNFCWMPYFFLLANRLANEAKLRDFVFLTVVTSVQFTAGYPEAVLDTSIMVGLMLLMRPVCRLRGEQLSFVIPVIAGAVALGAIVASAQTLPLVELSLEARRISMANIGSGATFNAYRLDRFWPPAFLVIMVLALARRANWLASSNVLLCLFIVDGGWLLLRSLPGFSFVRFPFGWALLAQFPFAWAAAVGADTLLTSTSEGRIKKHILLGVIGVGALLACAYSIERGLRLPVAPSMPQIISTVPSAVVGAFGSVLLCAVAIRIWRGRPAERWMVGAVLVLIVSQLLSYPFGHPKAALKRPAPHGKVKSLLDGRPVHGRALSVHDVLYGYNLTDGIPSIFGIEESFLPWRYREIIIRTQFMALTRSVDWNALLQARGLLDALNLEYVAATPSERELFSNYGFQSVRQAGDEVLYANPERMGTAWVNYTVRVLPSERAVRDHVLGPAFDPHVEVILESPPKGRYAARAEHLATPIKSERRPSPTELELEVELPRPGVLVISESAYPGWRAEVDGKPASWVRADYVLRGLELGPGMHRVRFVYRPMAFVWGLSLSAFGIVVVLALATVAFLQRKRSAST
jgi:hypothetical protein